MGDDRVPKVFGASPPAPPRGGVVLGDTAMSTGRTRALPAELRVLTEQARAALGEHWPMPFGDVAALVVMMQLAYGSKAMDQLATLMELPEHDVVTPDDLRELSKKLHNDAVQMRVDWFGR